VVAAAFATATGAPKWVTQFGSAGGDIGYGIQMGTGKLPGVYISGQTTGNLATNANTSVYGGYDAFVVKLSAASGGMVEQHAYGTAGDDVTGKLSRGAGLLYLPGGFGAGFVGQSADGCSFAGLRDIAVAKFCAAVAAP